MLRKSFSIVIASLMLIEAFLPATEMDELSKLPVLFTHFAKHQQEDPSISFLEFLQLHYDDANHHDLDHQTHDQFPLSGHQHQAHVQLHYMTITIVEVDAFISLISLHEINTVEYREPASSSLSFSIWQPPKALA
jgi:hypothetical protein